MTKRDERKTEANAHSALISSNVRFVAFGLLGVVFTLFTSDAEIARFVVEEKQTSILSVVVLAVLTLIFDSVQYAAAYQANEKAINRKDKPGVFNKKWPSYKIRVGCFWVKQTTSGIGGLLLILVLLSAAFCPPSISTDVTDPAVPSAQTKAEDGN